MSGLWVLLLERPGHRLLAEGADMGADAALPHLEGEPRDHPVHAASVSAATIVPAPTTRSPFRRQASCPGATASSGRSRMSSALLCRPTGSSSTSRQPTACER